MSEGLPTWVAYLNALTAPAIAIAGILIAGANLWLAYRRRKDDLFDRRYKFFLNARNAWGNAIKSHSNSGQTTPDWEARVILASEAKFLFGPEIVEHILEYRQPSHEDNHLIANDDFVLPFEPYLSLGVRGGLKI